MRYLRYFKMSVEPSTLIQAYSASPSAAHPALTCTLASASFICFKSYPLVELDIYLHMLAKQTKAFSGTIDHSPDLKLAYIDKNVRLLSILSGENNLTLAAEYHQLASSEHITKQAEQLLTRFNCNHVRYKLPAFMSTLEKRLLLIARALMLQPHILFIEKPFQGLDMHEHNVLGEHLMALARDLKVTIVSGYTTLSFMKKAAQQIIYCDNKAFYTYNNWHNFKQNHTELFDT